MKMCIRCGVELNNENWNTSSQKIKLYVCRQCNINYQQSLRDVYKIPKRIINLIPCECGCGIIIKDWAHGSPRRFVNGHNGKGVPKSEKTKQKMSDGQRGEKNNGWKGGKKLSNARHSAARRWFGFIPLNNCDVDGWVGHHIDYEHVIFIPEELHKSVWHSVLKNINMDIINDKVYEWFIVYYLRVI